MIEALCAGLILAMLFKDWFYLRQIQRLIDKNMSRNYPEYVSSVSYLKPKATSPSAETLPDDDTIQQSQVLDELNAALGPRF